LKTKVHDEKTRDLKAQLYHRYLKEEGYQPAIDGDGDVRFKKEGKAYFIQVDDKDEAFFRICFPNFWEIANDEERSRVLAACDYANALSKVAKIFTVRNDVWGSVRFSWMIRKDLNRSFQDACLPSKMPYATSLKG